MQMNPLENYFIISFIMCIRQKMKFPSKIFRIFLLCYGKESKGISQNMPIESWEHGEFKTMGLFDG